MYCKTFQPGNVTLSLRHIHINSRRSFKPFTLEMLRRPTTTATRSTYIAALLIVPKDVDLSTFFIDFPSGPSSELSLLIRALQPPLLFFPNRTLKFFSGHFPC